MVEFLNSLEWPGAFALVGSVVTIITGIFGYLLSIRKKDKPASTNPHPPTPIPTPVDQHQTNDIQNLYREVQKLHDRVSDIKDRTAYLDGDFRELRGYVKSLQKQLTDHEHRDIEDFRVMQNKIDKLMEIVIQMLQDE